MVPCWGTKRKTKYFNAVLLCLKPIKRNLIWLIKIMQTLSLKSWLLKSHKIKIFNYKLLWPTMKEEFKLKKSYKDCFLQIKCSNKIKSLSFIMIMFKDIWVIKRKSYRAWVCNLYLSFNSFPLIHKAQTKTNKK
jgi:hypothetical protein